MTQSNSAPLDGEQLAWKPRGDVRTLAQRRADFAAQMRDMALADLQAVAKRLQHLHDRLERKTEKKWTQQEIARDAKVAYRTYQSWAEAKNENRKGDGYRKLARFYARKLDDPSITYNWLVFDTQEPEKQSAGEAPATAESADSDRLEAIEQSLAELHAKLDELLSRLPEPAADDAAEDDHGLPDPEQLDNDEDDSESATG